MAAQHETLGLSLIDAVEALSNIVEFNPNQRVTDLYEEEIKVPSKKAISRAIAWLNRDEVDAESSHQTIAVVKEIFHVIFKYLKEFYRNEYANIVNFQTVERIKTIMVLVGEAAKKLDKFGRLFEKASIKSVTELKEYKQLQTFYLRRIARKIDEGTISKWLLALTQRAWDHRGEAANKLIAKKVWQSKHVFVDLESVKNDAEYELLLLRKEDGSRFYSPKLIRNIKLVCDFGDHFDGKGHKEDLLDDIMIWQDHCFSSAAKDILLAMKEPLSRYVREIMPHKGHDMVEALNKAFMALLLCANSQNQKKNNAGKKCREYFTDFQIYLRTALNTQEYMKLLTHSAHPSSKFATYLLGAVHSICMSLFEHLQFYQPLIFHLENLIRKAKDMQSPEHEQAARGCNQLWSSLASENKALVKLMKMHGQGPLIKVLDVLQDSGKFAFDPFILQDLPSRLYIISTEDFKTASLHLPSPTKQEFIDKATTIEEFQAFLRACEKNHLINSHLLINLQDRTSWREHFRALALEELPSNDAFEKHLITVTLTKDTDFYHQLEPYYQDNHAEVFIKHFKEHLEDINAGFFFPEFIQKEIFPDFLEGAIAAIHQVFFSKKNILLREHRLDFIEIFYLFLQLKLLEIVQPDSFSLTCKDGVDAGAAANAQLFAFLKILQGNRLTKEERERLNLFLYAPALVVRERLILPERFNRMASTIKCLESVKEQMGSGNFATRILKAFEGLYKTPILQAQIIIPQQS
jgi:hypothetical protein